MAANTSTIQIEIQVDGKGGIKVLRQIGTESEKTGKKGKKSFRDMDRSAGAFSARLTSVHGLLLQLGVGYAIIRTAREIMDLTGVASDLNETVSKSRAIFGEVSSDIEAWAAKSAVAIGLSTQETLEHTATLGNMYQQLGAGIDIAEQSSRSMVKLAADLASFHNVAGGASEVLLSMQSAFRGEYDALQRYIPTINAAAVQEKALAMTHKINAKELSNLEKALAAQAIIMRDAGAAVGDFERTSQEAANQQRILTANIDNLKATLGEKLLPIVTDVYREINAFIDSLSEEDLRLAAETITMIAQSFIGLGKAVAAVPSFIMKVAGAMETEVTILTDVNEVIETNINAYEKLKTLLAEPITTLPIGKIPGAIVPSGIGADQTKKDLATLKDLEREAAAAQEQFERAMIVGGGTGEIMAQQLRRGVGDNLKIMVQETEKQFTILDNLSQRTAEAMEQNFSDFYFDVMRGEFDDLGDYADAMLMSIQRATADVMGQMTKEALFGKGSGGGGLIQGIGKWIATSLFHGGGEVGRTPVPARAVPAPLFYNAPRLHRGLAGDEFPAILQKGETVYAKGSGPSIQVNVINESGEPLTAEQGDIRFDGQKYIAEVHIDKMINSSAYRRANRQALR